MSGKALTHPEREVLSAFGLGKLPAERARQVEAHIAECDPCCETLLDLQSDTFVDLVRSSNADGPRVATGDAADKADVPEELASHPRYRTVELLGRGGMGDVYKAQHRLMNRLVAVKVIKEEVLAQPTVVERFRREVQAAAQLSHANIVTAYDAEQARDAHFLVMEYVDGTDLAAFVKRQGPLSVEDACDFICQAAAGLQHAHECGMVHRDIKPHNLMVTSDGRVKILDFGLAAIAADFELEACTKRDPCAATSSSSSSEDPGLTSTENRLTNFGCMMGTPDFVSPEQATDAHAVDARSDIYSLGCTLHFLLTGEPPFPMGSVAEKLDAHRRRDAHRLDVVRDDIPQQLADAVRRAMEKDPAVRFQTCAELTAAIEPFAAARATLKHDAAQVHDPRPTHRYSRYGRWTSAIIAAAVILVLAVPFVLHLRETAVRFDGDGNDISREVKSKEVAGPARESVAHEPANPNINASREYPDVFHSPSADETPRVFRSILQLEFVIKRDGMDPQMVYADGTVVSSDGLIATVLDDPGATQQASGGIESATALMLDGSSVVADLVAYSPAYGVAILRVADLNLPHLTLSERSLVTNQRVSWNAVYKDGRKTYLYSRPLRIYQSAHTVGVTTDLCQIIDTGSSALSPARSGSAVVSHDGSLVALMGRQKHWEIADKGPTQRKKLAWGVPAKVIARLLTE